VTYTVKWYSGDYSGTRTVNAEDTNEALRKVKAWVSAQRFMGLRAEGYRVVDAGDDDDCDD